MDFHARQCRRASLCGQRPGGPEPALNEAERLQPGFWAITWESRRNVLTQVSVKNRREPGVLA
jgi:hypothetical protein